MLREQIEERLEKYNQYKKLINHKTQGMAVRGYYDPIDKDYKKFTPEAIEAAEDQVDKMIEFYEDLLEME